MRTFIARQPILDRRGGVFGYELLFRSGLEAAFDGLDPDYASSRVIVNSVILMGLETLTAGRHGFFNVTRRVLDRGWSSLLPQRGTVLEILETVEPDREVLEICERLKREGYLLALDDFVDDGRLEPLLPLADFVKVDFRATADEALRRLAARLAGRRVRLVAEKVETHEEYHAALAMGFDYFQGFFFSRPRVLSSRDVPGFKLHYLQLLRELSHPELDLHGTEEIIRREMSFAYKLLRYINSAHFGWRDKVDSIRRALVLLGEREVRKWAVLVALSGMAEDKVEELIVQALVRARLCEAAGARVTGVAQRADDLFLMGMFSLLDAVLDRPLEAVLQQLPLADDVAAALLGDTGPLGDVLEFSVCCERGDFAGISERAARVGLDERSAPGLYLDAVRWAEEAFRGAVETASATKS